MKKIAILTSLFFFSSFFIQAMENESGNSLVRHSLNQLINNEQSSDGDEFFDAEDDSNKSYGQFGNSTGNALVEYAENIAHERNNAQDSGKATLSSSSADGIQSDGDIVRCFCGKFQMSYPQTMKNHSAEKHSVAQCVFNEACTFPALSLEPESLFAAYKKPLIAVTGLAALFGFLHYTKATVWSPFSAISSWYGKSKSTMTGLWGSFKQRWFNSPVSM
ncbi:MAG: hypothetical protein WCE21_01245 [Candidatus Babeliales bacterium]